MVVFIGCKDDPEVRSLEEDHADLVNYLSVNNVTVAPSINGVYFIETKKVGGFPADSGEFLVFDYSLSTVNGVELEQGQEFFYHPEHNNVIPGLREGLLKMEEGDEATIIIPSEQAYGTKGSRDIDPNMTVIFDIVLKEVKGVKEEAIRLINYVNDNAITSTPTHNGLYYMETSAGTGDSVKTGDKLNIVYKGMYLNGEVFDESEEGKVFKYTHNLTDVIPGFREGVGMMKKGGKARIILPYNLAYGKDGLSEFFPYTYFIYPYTTIMFDLEIVD